MDKKGQAAVEFLMTYGWAILAAIIAIGVLAYFGVFSPGKFTPTATVVNQPFYANAWNVIDSTNTVSLELKNNGGETYNVTSVSISPTDGATTCTDDDVVGPATAGGVVTAGVVCGDLEAAGNTFKGDITVRYTKPGSSLELTSTGTIADKIVP